MQSLNNKELFFYNSETHPLGSEALKVLDNNQEQVTCPVCNGRGKLGEMTCPKCDDMGTIKEKEAENIDLAEFDEFVCPVCNGRLNTSCEKCNGSQVLTRETLLDQ